MGRQRQIRSGVGSIVALLAAALVVGGCGRDETPQVRSCFQAYRQALLARDGPRAATLVSQTTVDYYGELKQLVLEGGPDEIGRRPIADRMSIALIRLRMDPDDVRTRTPAELIAYAVNEGWIGEQGVRNASLGEVRLEGDLAWADFRNQGQTTPISYRFEREDGTWRIDLTSIMPPANAALAQMARQQNLTEDELIFRSLEYVTGETVDASIWERP